jgi:hypothetical protein
VEAQESLMAFGIDLTGLSDAVRSSMSKTTNNPFIYTFNVMIQAHGEPY